MESEEKELLEENKKIKIHPIFIFIFISFCIIVLSAIAKLFNLSVTYDEINPLTGKIETSLATVNSLLSYDGIKYMIGDFLKNIINFGPLSMVIISMFGIGVAEKSGYLKVLMTKITKWLPKKYITFFIILLGICSSLTIDVGYAILIPLSALIFLINNRNPLAGVLAAFAGVSVGYGLNLFVGPIDQVLATYTTHSANIIDSGYEVTMASNWYFMIIATFILSFVGMLITEKIVVPKLGRYKNEEDFQKVEITEKEKKGLRCARTATIIICFIFLYMIIPGLPWSGALLDNEEVFYINKLFSYDSSLSSGIVFLFSFLFLIGGICYGIGTKRLKHDKDIVKIMISSFDNIGIYIVYIIFAAELITLFNYTNLGTIFLVTITKLVSGLSFTGIPLIILLFIITILLTIIIPSTTAKWAIMAPIFVPMFMQLNLSPEFTQLIFRAGDSIAKPLSLFLPYFAFILALIYKYNKKGITTIKQTLGIMSIYSLIIGLIWFALIIGWYIIGLPIGPESYPSI